MTLQDINSKISFLTGADTTSGGFATADRVSAINNYYQRVLTFILRSQDEWDFDDASITSTYPLAKRNLVANQEDYKFSTAQWALTSPEGGADASVAAISPFRLKRVEVSYDSTNWYQAFPFDINQMSSDNTTTTINNLFQTTKPFYDLQWNAIFLKPVPTANVTKGLKVWFDRSITEYTSADLTTGTKVPGFDANFHQILAYGPAYEFALAYGKANGEAIKAELTELFVELMAFYGKKDTDRNWQLASNFGDNRYGS